MLDKVSSYIFAAAQYSGNKHTTGAGVWQPAQKRGGSCKKEGFFHDGIYCVFLYISTLHTQGTSFPEDT